MIISVLGIVAVSVIFAKWSAASVGSVSWIFMTVMQSVLRFSSPVIIMISGIKYLSETEAPPIKKLYSCDILRLSIMLIFWSVLYVVLKNISEAQALSVSSSISPSFQQGKITFGCSVC